MYSQPILDYTERHEFQATLSAKTIRVISKPGLPAWDKVTPSESLLAQNTSLPVDGRALLLGSGHGAVATFLAQQIPAGRMWLMDNSHIALELSNDTLRANDVNNVRVHTGISLSENLKSTFDTVIIDLPKGRKLARRWLVEAFYALRMDGELYLAGPNDWGIQSAIKDAELLIGKGVVLAYKKGNRIIRMQKTKGSLPERGWWQEPGIAPGTWHEFQINTPQGTFSLRTLPGIFSYDRLDPGTNLLLTSLKVTPEFNVLDLGCGYGIIGLCAARSGAAHVDFIDANLLAIAATQENLALNTITNAHIFASDVLEAAGGKRYHLIATNPPFHTGKSVDYQVTEAFICQSWNALEDGGQFLLVANKFIRYERLIKKKFRHVSTINETGGYHVLLASK